MGRPDIEEIKSRIDIVELIGRYITLKPAGKNYKGRCPFHPDDTPSLVVSPEKGLWHCFGCGAGGDAIGFLMKIEKLSFPEALAKLAQEVGVELRGGGAKTELYKICQEAADYFARELASPSGRRAQEYLESRGIGRDEWSKWGLGYAPNRWDGLIKALGRFGVDRLAKLGLLVQGERGYYDRFRDRVMFTLRDDQGRPIAFAGRAFGDLKPKYLNVPNTPLFTKGTILYGLDVAKGPIRERGRAVLVEGYTDVISMHRAGFPETVGSMGTALTQSQARLLSRYTDRVVIAYDRDAAGSAASLRGMVILREAGLDVLVARLPEGEDPDSLARGQGPASVTQILEEAQPFHRFFLDSLAERYDLASVEGAEAALEEARDLWSRMTSLPLKAELARGLAELLGIPEEDIRGAMRGSGHRTPVSRPRPAKRSEAEEILVRFLVLGKLPPEVVADLEGAEFRPEYRQIVEGWFAVRNRGDEPSPQRLMDELDEEGQATLAGLLMAEMPLSDEDRAIADAAAVFLHLPRIERRLAELEKEVARAEAQGDGESLSRLEEEYQALCRRRLELLRRRL